MLKPGENPPLLAHQALASIYSFKLSRAAVVSLWLPGSVTYRRTLLSHLIGFFLEE